MLFRKRMTTRQLLTKDLEKELRKASKGRMPKEEREILAKRTVEKLDFNNPYQMQRSLKSYAEDIVFEFFYKRRIAR